MFALRFVLAAVIVAAAASLPAQILVSNGSFTFTGKRIGDGSMPPNRLTAWQVAYGTPRIVNEIGVGRDPGYIRMRGNQAIRQPVSLRKGVRYTVSFRTRHRRSKTANARIELRASRESLDSPQCPPGTCELMTGAKYDAKTRGKWRKVLFEFAASKDFTYLTISTSNDQQAAPSADIDDVSIELAHTAVAPLFNADAPGAIGGHYIVLFKKATSLAEVQALESKVDPHGTDIVFRYGRAPASSPRPAARLLGFAIRCSPETLELIRRNENVLWVEADHQFTSTSTTQTAPPRGLDRIDRRLLPLNDTFQYSETGQGVHVYVFDTGIHTAHPEFGGRASGAFTAIADKHGMDDCHGHGTHVAATVGGAQFGVAKNVTLHAMRVLDCHGEGSVAGLMSAVEWLTLNHIDPAVANLSIIVNGRSEALESAITESIEAGVTYVVSAGNRADDACKYSPAAVPTAITVGAATITENHPLDDTRFILSNHGPCLDLFAPGAGILSAWITGDPPMAVKSGASMAAAHVSGVAALVLELNPRATPAEVWNTIHENNNVSDTHNWSGVRSAGTDSPNELLHWAPRGVGGSP